MVMEYAVLVSAKVTPADYDLNLIEDWLNEIGKEYIDWEWDRQYIFSFRTKEDKDKFMLSEHYESFHLLQTMLNND